MQNPLSFHIISIERIVKSSVRNIDQLISFRKINKYWEEVVDDRVFNLWLEVITEEQLLGAFAKGKIYIIRQILLALEFVKKRNKVHRFMTWFDNTLCFYDEINKLVASFGYFNITNFGFSLFYGKFEVVRYIMDKILPSPNLTEAEKLEQLLINRGENTKYLKIKSLLFTQDVLKSFQGNRDLGLILMRCEDFSRDIIFDLIIRDMPIQYIRVYLLLSGKGAFPMERVSRYISLCIQHSSKYEVFSLLFEFGCLDATSAFFNFIAEFAREEKPEVLSFLKVILKYLNGIESFGFATFTKNTALFRIILEKIATDVGGMNYLRKTYEELRTNNTYSLLGGNVAELGKFLEGK